MNTHIVARRFQFSLVTLLIAVACVAVCVQVAVTSDWLAGAGLFLALLLGYGSRVLGRSLAQQAVSKQLASS